jgi:Pentapeptide repeats (8 copies)
MRVRLHRKRPEPWNVRRQGLKRGWTVPLWAFEWFCEWIAYVLSNWSFLEVLEYLSSFGVLIAVIFYFGESGDRLKQKHYQAWQVINTAQGKGGNGGRIEALQELNADGIPLVGVDVSGAFLQGIHLQSARLSRSNFSAADLRNSNLNSADMSDADLRSANFRESTLRNAHFEHADLTEADLSGADLSGADLSGTVLPHADLRNTNLANLKWRDVLNLKNANIFGVKNAPEGFVAYALKRGAIQIESDNQ